MEKNKNKQKLTIYPVNWNIFSVQVRSHRRWENGKVHIYCSVQNKERIEGSQQPSG